MPVPIIMSAVKVDPRVASSLPTTTLDRRGAIPKSTDMMGGKDGGGKAKGGGLKEAMGEGDEEKSMLHGSIVLRHYYLGATRAKCLESAVSSVPIDLRQVILP